MVFNYVKFLWLIKCCIWVVVIVLVDKSDLMYFGMCDIW